MIYVVVEQFKEIIIYIKTGIMGLRGQQKGLAYQLKMAYEGKKFLNFSTIKYKIL